MSGCSCILASVQLFLIIFIIYVEYLRKSVSIFLWSMLLILFGVMHSFTVFSGSSNFPAWVYDRASLFVIGFCTLYLFTRRFLCPVYALEFPKQWTHVTADDATRQDKLFLKVTFGILCLCVLYRVFTMWRGAGSLLATSWGSMREVATGGDYFSLGRVVTCLFSYSSACLLLSIYWKNKKLAILSAILILFQVLVTRNRIEILPILTTVIAYNLYNGSRLSLRLIVRLCCLGILSVIVIYALQIFRYYGNFIQFVENFNLSDFIATMFGNMSEGKGDIGLREVFYYFIEQDNEFENFGQGHTYLRMLLVFVPEAWSCGIKPPDFAISMGTALGIGEEGFSTHPTLFGDCYANFGYWGIFMGIMWAFIVQALDYIQYRKDVGVKICLIGLYANAYIIMGRGSVYNAYIWMVVGIVLMLIIHNFIYSNNRLNIAGK